MANAFHWMQGALAAIALLASPSALATHIIGGDMYYDYLGGNVYRVTLRLYRDCGPDNTNGTGFDASAQLAVYTASGSLYTSISVSDPGESTVPVVLNDPCLTAPPSVCVRTTQYVQLFTLPPIAGGYTISYQRCCRTPAMINLAGLQGLTCTVRIPGPPNAANGSPRFNQYPGIALCLGQDMSFDQSATDPDGDQLVYSLCDPYQGADPTNPSPLASPPPYSTVNWAAGYSGASPINSNPPIAIDAATGQLTVHPTLQGTFVIGICAAEYRNGVLLGTARRDFMFRVVACDATVIAAIGPQLTGQTCNLTQTFPNASTNGQIWLWDFGDPATTADVSTQQAPSYTYPGPGNYTVTLIVNPGYPCADTTTALYVVAQPVAPQVALPAPLCSAQEVTLTAGGALTASATIQWSLGAGATPSSGTGSTITAFFDDSGAHPITVTATELGCTGTFNGNVQVNPQPTAAIGPQMSFCDSLAFAFENLSQAATAYAWDFGDPGIASDQSTAPAPTWTYSAQGFHQVRLIARNGPVCADTAYLTMDAHLRPDAFFYRPPVRCPGELAHLSAQGELTPQATVVWTPAADAEQVMEAGNQLHLAFTQVGAHPITLTMTEYGCTASYTDSVTVYPFPTVDFTVDPGVCLGSPLRFVASAQASTPIQLSWDLGDDSMASGAEVLHTYAAPGSFTVRLTGTTHSGCIATVSEHKPGIAQVHPLPVAAFTALPEEVSLLDPRITVTDYASDAVAWSYAIDGQVVAVPGFEHVFDDGGIYRIQQTVTSAHGCTDETERIVVVSDHLFFAPTAFTPDGDGLNDVWLPSVRGARHYELVIYDRWGIERFRTDDPKQGWSGDGLPQSLYIYTAHIKEWGAFAKDYTGHFSLLR